VEAAATEVIGPTLMVPAKFVGKWLCENTDLVKKMYAMSIGLIRRIVKNRKENENIDEPELQKTANVIFTGLLKRNKEFLAACLKKIIPGKNQNDPTGTGTIFRKSIASL
jgi:hypothetical protein